MPAYKIEHFCGGLSDWEDRGILGAFKFGANLNIRRAVDSLYCNQDLEEIGLVAELPSASSSPSPSSSISASPSASVSPSPSQTASFSISASRSPSASASPSSSVSPSASVSPSISASGSMETVFRDLVRFWVKSATGFLYGFGSTGYIYRIDTDGHIVVVYKDPDGTIKGAEEGYSDDGRVWAVWTTDTKVKRKPLPGLSNWNDVETVGSDLTSSDWHTCRQVNGATLIANGSNIALLGYDSSYTNNALDLIPGNLAKTLVERNGRTIIGTVRASDPTRGVNAAIDSEVPLSQVGEDGEVFFANMVDSMPIKRFPGGGKVNPGGICNEVEQVNFFEWEETALSWIDKQSVGNLALFAVYGAESGKGGVYSYGRKDKNKDFVMNLEYQLDADELGAVVVFDGKTYVSYQLNGAFGVKATDPNNKAVGIYEGLDWHGPVKGVAQILPWQYVSLLCAPLPSGAALEFWYRMNKNGNFVQAALEDGSTQYTTVSGQKAVFLVASDGEIYEPKVILRPAGNNSPEVYKVLSYFK